tara:strand:- start:271 stop:576 length:306 start_codon:yes stop_codon:yes gene_type:complete
MGFLTKLKEIIMGPNVDFKELIENGAVIIDVRSPGEFQSGNAKGSKNIPVENIGVNTNQFKGKEVILVCRSGARAGSAKSTLEKSGITAYNAGAWQNLNGL